MSVPPQASEVHALLGRVLEESPDRRAAFLDRACAGRPALRERIERLLLLSERDAGFLDRGAVRTGTEEPGASAYAAGRSIGAYRLLRPLGRGGMAEVWLAEREDGGFRQQAALKLIPHARGSLSQRFATERSILAGLAHPHIARLYDGGVDADGTAYMVMEYVEGEHLTAYARARALSLGERLGLFLQVCDAVAYAHMHLIVHRDLKPSNILVTAAGKATLLDFGIAKLLDAQEESERTRTVYLSPSYAAPEQLASGAASTAIDVYALGVILFELLTDRRPWRDDEAPMAVAVKRLLDTPLPAPSRVVRSGSPVPEHALRGDLDAIVAKCLRREPAHRYTVNGLKLDLQRHLAREPVMAREGARLYVLARMLRRYRWAVAATAALILALAAGLAGTLWQARRAQAEARRSSAVKEFLLGVFKASDPRIASDKPRGQISARELLDVSAARIDQRFADDPDTRIELLRTAADIYRELGEREAAQRLEARELDLTRQRYGHHHPNLLDAAVQAGLRACTADATNGCAEAQAHAAALLDAAHDADPQRRGAWWTTEGLRLQTDEARLPDAEAAFENAVAVFEAGAPRSRGYVTALIELGSFQQVQLRYDDSVATFRRALDIAGSLPERNDAELTTLWNNLGTTYQQAGRYAEAAAAFGNAADSAERTTGADSIDARVPRGSAARTLHLAGEREAAWREYARLMPNLPPLDALDRDVVLIRLYHGDRLSAEGRAAEAIPELEAAARYLQAEHANAHQPRQSRRLLGEAYLRAGRRDDARRELKAALDDYLAHDADRSQPTMAARESYGRLLLEDGDAAAANEQFAAVVAAAEGRELAHVALAHGGLARAALASGDRAAALRESAAALSVWNEVSGFRDVRMGPYLQRVRADALAAAGEVDAAQRLEDLAAAASARYDDPSSPTVRRRDLHRTPAR